ncbi:MAG: hypothetical protein WD491_07265 [Balneolales bacterium]
MKEKSNKKININSDAEPKRPWKKPKILEEDYRQTKQTGPYLPFPPGQSGAS